jgi:hypothetical protein
MSSAQKRRVATMYNRQSDGSLKPAPFEMPQRPEFFSGGGGLFSLFPNWKGQRQSRIVKLDDKELHLSPNRPLMFNGSLKMPTIIWRRANPNV